MAEHSTIYYDIEGLVLRRGQVFSFTITFNRSFNSDKYHLSIIFKCQTWLNSSYVKIPLNSSFNGWSAKRIFPKDENNNRISFEINSPSDAIIGKYFVSIKKSFLHRNLSLLFASFYSKFVRSRMVY
jgi:uncharacterized membrane protein